MHKEKVLRKHLKVENFKEQKEYRYKDKQEQKEGARNSDKERWLGKESKLEILWYILDK